MQATMTLLQRGVRNAVRDCMGVKPDDRVLIVSDDATSRIGEELRAQVSKTGAELLFIRIEDYGARPMLSLPGAMKEDISSFKPTASIFAAQGQKGELSFRSPLREHILTLGARHGHMIGVTEEIMRMGMQADYNKVAAVTRKLYEMVGDAKRIEVRTPAGTDLSVEFSPELRWKLCTGLLHTGGEWSNLPDGELFTCPHRISGTLVVDGCLGDWMDTKYGRIAETPVRIKIVDSRAVIDSVECANPDLRRDVKEYLAQYENSDRVGEFAIGTNIALTEIVGKLLQDEKFPGVHVAFGDPYPDDTGADWSCESHLDGVMRETTIIVDGRTIMEGGRFIDAILG